MSIFFIAFIVLAISFFVFLVGALISTMVYHEDVAIALTIIVSVAVFIDGLFVGVGLNTEEAQVWSAKYEAQKTTIEQSLDSEVLSGLERIELVKQASELNGELAERQATAELWHVVYYDENVYAGLEPICIN